MSRENSVRKSITDVICIDNREYSFVSTSEVVKLTGLEPSKVAAFFKTDAIYNGRPNKGQLRKPDGTRETIYFGYSVVICNDKTEIPTKTDVICNSEPEDIGKIDVIYNDTQEEKVVKNNTDVIYNGVVQNAPGTKGPVIGTKNFKGKFANPTKATFSKKTGLDVYYGINGYHIRNFTGSMVDKDSIPQELHDVWDRAYMGEI